MRNYKIFLRQTVLIVFIFSTAIFSCEKDGEHQQKQNAVYIAPVSNVSIAESKTLLFSTVPIGFEISAAITSAEKDDIKVTLEINNDLVSTFNSLNHTNYQVMPGGSFSLEAEEVTIPSASMASAKTNVIVNTSLLEFDKQYLLPVAVASVSSPAVVNNQALSTKYFIVTVPTPVVGNLSDGKSSRLSQGANPGRGNDGNTDGDWTHGSVCETGAGNEEYWEVDLGAISPRIDTVRIWNRTDCCSERTSKFYVFISDVPFSGESVSSSLDQAGVYKYYQEEKVGLPTIIFPNVSGRYIRLQNTTTESLTLAELTAIGIKP